MLLKVAVSVTAGRAGPRQLSSPPQAPFQCRYTDCVAQKLICTAYVRAAQHIFYASTPLSARVFNHLKSARMKVYCLARHSWFMLLSLCFIMFQ